MNRTRRKAIKMARRRESNWQTAPPADWASEPLRQSMRAIYNQCSNSDTPRLPDVACVTGELVNRALGTTDYDPTRGYVVGAHGIEPM